MKWPFASGAKAGFITETHGASAVEFAMIAPVFFLLLFGAIECGQMLWTQNALQYAVERAARCAIINLSTCTQSYAASLVYGQNLSAAIFSVTSASCGTKISASLPFTAIVIPIQVTLTASSCRPT
jgi:Flp pilus assembly protein TadG